MFKNRIQFTHYTICPLNITEISIQVKAKRKSGSILHLADDTRQFWIHPVFPKYQGGIIGPGESRFFIVSYQTVDKIFTDYWFFISGTTCEPGKKQCKSYISDFHEIYTKKNAPRF